MSTYTTDLDLDTLLEIDRDERETMIREDRPTDEQIEAMLEGVARTEQGTCANCGDPLTDDGGLGYYCAACTVTAVYHD